MTDDVLSLGDRVGRGVECSGCGQDFDGVGGLTDHDCPAEDDSMEGVECGACGTQFFGVNQTECERWKAAHLIDEHEDEAPDRLLEQARERLAEIKEATA